MTSIDIRQNRKDLTKDIEALTNERKTLYLMILGSPVYDDLKLVKDKEEEPVVLTNSTNNYI